MCHTLLRTSAKSDGTAPILHRGSLSMTGDARIDDRIEGAVGIATEDAMRRYQADHGWQSKQVPDSRALISLGLGPSNDHLLNPESAMTSGSTVSHAAAPVSSPSQSPLSHSAEPGARMSTNPAPTADPAQATSPDRDAPAPQ